MGGARRSRDEAARSAAAAPPLLSPLPADVAFAWAALEDPGEAGALPAEQALLSPRAAPERVREFVLGRVCARAALARLDAAAGREPILRADARRPQWPAGFVGAITHKAGHAAAVAAWAADYRALGLDLERVRAPSALLRRILRPEERERLAGLPEGARAAAFTLAFSAKESVFKALNPLTGLFLGFQDAAIEPADDPGAGGGRFVWRLHRACGPAFPAGCTGPGAFTRAGDLVLTGVWVPVQQGGG